MREFSVISSRTFPSFLARRQMLPALNNHCDKAFHAHCRVVVKLLKFANLKYQTIGTQYFGWVVDMFISSIMSFSWSCMNPTKMFIPMHHSKPWSHSDIPADTRCVREGNRSFAAVLMRQVVITKPRLAYRMMVRRIKRARSSWHIQSAMRGRYSVDFQFYQLTFPEIKEATSSAVVSGHARAGKSI